MWPRICVQARQRTKFCVEVIDEDSWLKLIGGLKYSARVDASKEFAMRKIEVLSALALAGFALSGCAVASVGGAVVGGAVSVVSTTVHVTGDVVKGAADVAT